MAAGYFSVPVGGGLVVEHRRAARGESALNQEASGMQQHAYKATTDGRWTRFETAIGPAVIVAGAGGVRRIVLRPDEGSVGAWLDQPGARRDDGHLADAAAALRSMIDGRPVAFPLEPDFGEGAPFHKLVWGELLRIPHGETTTYGCIAARLGNPGASRAVGQANARNSLPVLVPCHRVVAAGGRLGGYTGGLDIKRHLLAAEQAFVAGART